MRTYIGGEWRPCRNGGHLDVFNPATGQRSGRAAEGGVDDIGMAVEAARSAFEVYSKAPIEDRISLLERILQEYMRRSEEMAAAITEEMGAPLRLSRDAQVPIGAAHLMTAIDVLKRYAFETAAGTTLIVREPIGVCGLITPWNWPMNQILGKVAPALAAGCTVVLKPSELAPYSACLLAEMLHDAGAPPGVFNMVPGKGAVAGMALAEHPEVDMISITGSTRTGVAVARAAAESVKRVHQELGGKSANIILDDAPLDVVIPGAIRLMMMNAGQNCNAPSRLLVPRARLAEVIDLGVMAVKALRIGDPREEVDLGPVVSAAQWDRIQSYINMGVAEGARLVTGGAGRPVGLEVGNYVRPTVFADVTNDMVIAREEVFGPVLSILAYENEAEAISIANDTDYGLAAYVQSADPERALSVARKLRAGQVSVNGAPVDPTAPFGGYKRSGNGREWGEAAFHEFVEVKAIIGAVVA